MKSIKEKAEEYSRYIASSEYTKEDFISGANYVLEEIEKVIHSNSNCEKAFFELGKLVIQLKK